MGEYSRLVVRERRPEAQAGETPALLAGSHLTPQLTPAAMVVISCQQPRQKQPSDRSDL